MAASPLFRTALGRGSAALTFGYLIGVVNPLQMLSLAVRPFSATAFREFNRSCARHVWGLWVLVAEFQNRIELRFSGDPIGVRENSLVLPNHQSIADVMVLLSYGWRAGRLGDMKWFVKDPIKYVPGPGWGMRFLDCIYVKRNWAQDEGQIHRLFDKFKREQIPLMLVSFLEGTRKTPAKHRASREFAQSRGLYVPEHTMVPRTKGFAATLSGLRDHLDAVHDVTIAYPQGVPTLFDCFEGRVGRVDVHVRRHPAAGLPADFEALSRWAFDRFREKDELLEHHRRHGAFPGPWRTEPIRASDWFRAEHRRQLAAGADDSRPAA
ncbi:MAG TPA: lysophospholipid acyltransferase family protein [Myxococcales bacterium LLY-WYZ-16_1]|nr:lysophospholipid acyltransferase family protein [Myxococcales bacterium LLY-WYZ-16_1]